MRKCGKPAHKKLKISKTITNSRSLENRESEDCIAKIGDLRI